MAESRAKSASRSSSQAQSSSGSSNKIPKDWKKGIISLPVEQAGLEVGELCKTAESLGIDLWSFTLSGQEPISGPS